MKILDIALKDLLRSFRSYFAVGMMFGAPLLITGLIFMAFGGLSAGTGKFNLPPLSVAIVNQDHPATGSMNLGQSLVSYLRDERMPAWLKVNELSDEASARNTLARQAIGVAIILPTDFSATALGPQGATIVLLQDPALTTGPSILKDILQIYADGISGAKIAISTAGELYKAKGLTLDPAAMQPISQDYSTWFTALQQSLHHGADPLLDVQIPRAGSGNSSNDTMARLIAQVMAGMMIFFVFFGAAYTAQSILKEDEEGTLARLFSTPTPRAQILAGKFVSVFVTVGVQSVVLVAVSSIVFGIHWGAPLPLMLICMAMVTVATGFGLLLISLIKTVRQSGPVLGGVLSVTGMLGGLFSAAVPNMPAAFNAASLLMPQGWAMRGLKQIIDGASVPDVLLPAGLMLAMGVVFFTLGALRFQKRFA
jgi:ABC-2 type transport system permease protein